MFFLFVAVHHDVLLTFLLHLNAVLENFGSRVNAKTKSHKLIQY